MTNIPANDDASMLNHLKVCEKHETYFAKKGFRNVKWIATICDKCKTLVEEQLDKQNSKQTKFDILEQEITERLLFFVSTALRLTTSDKIQLAREKILSSISLKEFDSLKSDELLMCEHKKKFKITFLFIGFPLFCPQIKIELLDKKYCLTIYFTLDFSEIEIYTTKYQDMEKVPLLKEGKLYTYQEGEISDSYIINGEIKSTISDAFICKNSDESKLRFFTEDEWLSRGMSGGKTFTEKIKFVINMLLWGFLLKNDSNYDENQFLYHLLRLIETEEIFA